MKRTLTVIISLCVFVAAPQRAAHAADQTEEEQLIGVLQSDQSLQDKDAACVRLKRIGTERCIPALAALLNNEQLSQSARYVLESMPLPQAGEALLAGLADPATPLIEVGLIHSLAVRGDKAAEPKLAGLLSDTNTIISVAAAEALGSLGGSPALKALTAAAPTSTGALHDAEVDGLLMLANQALAKGNNRLAVKIFQPLYNKEANQAVRLAAFRGLALASGRHETTMITEAIAGNDEPSEGAALQLAVTLKGSSATRALAALLPKVSVPVQIALLQCLGQRGDPAAGKEVAGLMQSPDANVRLAAIAALGDLGNGSVALPLAKVAASGSGAEKAAARQSLIDLRRGPVVLITLLDTQPTDIQLELIRAMGGRGEGSAVPALLKLAHSEDDAIRDASLQALALLAGPEQVSELVQLVVNAKSDDARSEAADALSSACQHIEIQDGHCDSEPVVQALQSAPLAARLALLPVCSGLSEAPIREIVRTELKDTDPAMREAATRTLCDTRDPELLPDLLAVAVSSDNPKFRVLAIRGCVRLMTEEDAAKLSSAKKLEALQQILNTPLDVAEKRLVLSALGTIADPQALTLVSPLLHESDVKAEAAQATVSIARSISSAQPEEAGNALKKVLAMSITPATRRSAERALKSIQ